MEIKFVVIRDSEFKGLRKCRAILTVDDLIVYRSRMFGPILGWKNFNKRKKRRESHAMAFWSTNLAAKK